MQISGGKKKKKKPIGCNINITVRLLKKKKSTKNINITLNITKILFIKSMSC